MGRATAFFLDHTDTPLGRLAIVGIERKRWLLAHERPARDGAELAFSPSDRSSSGDRGLDTPTPACEKP
jgi:hypothetical protein